VQFHPESILSAEDGHGSKLMENVLKICSSAHVGG